MCGSKPFPFILFLEVRSLKIIRIDESPYGTLLEFDSGEELFLLPEESKDYFKEPRY